MSYRLAARFYGDKLVKLRARYLDCKARVSCGDGQVNYRPHKVGISEWKGLTTQVNGRERENCERGKGLTQQEIVTISRELGKISPGFRLPGDRIQILGTPCEFWKTLCDRLRSAQRRIYLSTLYIGKGERELIEVISLALRKNDRLTLSIVVDALRGTREAPCDHSSASLLAPLTQEFGNERVKICLFHTPNLREWKRKLVGKRWNEGWGLHHMKLYGVDDELILTGANLSEDYFRNRQDRYFVISDAMVVDFFYKVHEAVCNMSFGVRVKSELTMSQDGKELKECPDNFEVIWPKCNSVPSPLQDWKAYTKGAACLMDKFFRPDQWDCERGCEQKRYNDTIIFPVLQLTPIVGRNISTEMKALEILFKNLRSISDDCLTGDRYKHDIKHHVWTFTTAYLNVPEWLKELLLRSSPSKKCIIIVAGEKANGFYGAKGMASWIPKAYKYLTGKFEETINRLGMNQRIDIREWEKEDKERWTYHAKGIWVNLFGEREGIADPSITMIGSSNYSERAYLLDLEAGAMIITVNEGLKKSLEQERMNLVNQTISMNSTRRNEPAKSRKVPVYIKLAVWTVNKLGAAL